MKIAHFISLFPYKEQFTYSALANRYVCMGGEFATYHLVVELARMGHEVEVFTSSVGNHDEVEQYDGLTIYRYASAVRVGDTLFAPGLFWKPDKRLQDVDIIHVHHTTPPGGAAALSCVSRCRKPLVVTHHGFETPDSYGNLIRRLLVFLSAKYYVDYLFKRAKVLICISESFKRNSKFLWKYEDKIALIPNGVDLQEYGQFRSKKDIRDELGIPLSAPVVLYMGSLIPPKGVDVLLDAIRLVQQTLPDVMIIFVGRGILREELEKKATEFGLQNQIRFPGYIADSSIKNSYYCASDVLAIPSWNEMFPLVLLEGFASGCAMVVSDLETFRNIIRPDDNGLVARVGNSRNFADAILRLLPENELNKKISTNALATARQYDWKVIAEKTTAVYEKAINNVSINLMKVDKSLC